MNPKDIKIPKRDFGANPYLGQQGAGRAISEWEAACDMCKDSEQLLADIHEESLTVKYDSIHRTLARMASMQLRIQKEQRTTNWLLFVFALLAMFFGGIQAWFTIWPRENSQVSVVVPTLQSQQPPNQQHLLIPIAPIKPLELDVFLRKEEK